MCGIYYSWKLFTSLFVNGMRRHPAHEGLFCFKEREEWFRWFVNCSLDVRPSKNKEDIKMKHFNKLCVSLAVFLGIIAVSAPISALAADSNNKANYFPTQQYVSDTYKADEAYTAKVEEKQRLAENLYQATVCGNAKLASQYKTQFEEFSNPNLFKALKNNAQPAATSLYSLPAAFRIWDLYQVPQEKNYYCGAAAAKSILDNIGIYKSQTTLASNSYLQTERFGNTPWYLSNGNEFTQFPMATTLMNAQWEVGDSAFGYVPSPLGPAGSNPLTVEQCKSYVMSTTSAFDDGYGVAACGSSVGSNPSYRLPGYPTNSNIGHWIVSDGYKDNGSTIWIVDPAKSSAVSWSGSISAYYSIPASLFRNFIQPRGIIW